MSRHAVVALGLATAVVIGGIAAGYADTGDEGTTTTDRNVDLLARARQRTVQHDYSGVVVVHWYDAAGRDHAARALVRYDDGLVEIGGNGRVVTADPNDVVLGRAPRADDKYDVTRTTGRRIASHPTTRFEVRRDRDGLLVERFYVDDASGLVLQRESYDDHGRLRRSLAFTKVWSDAERAGLPHTVTSTTTRPRPVGSVELPYRAPSRGGDGFRLVGRWRRPKSVVQLSYSDGIVSASVFEQPGRLDWEALPAGGVAAEVGGRPAVAYSLPVGDVLVWERAGVVYTCVGDAPRTDLLRLAADVSRRARDDTMNRLARVVLAPFGW